MSRGCCTLPPPPSLLMLAIDLPDRDRWLKLEMPVLISLQFSSLIPVFTPLKSPCPQCFYALHLDPHSAVCIHSSPFSSSALCTSYWYCLFGLFYPFARVRSCARPSPLPFHLFAFCPSSTECLPSITHAYSASLS